MRIFPTPILFKDIFIIQYDLLRVNPRKETRDLPGCQANTSSRMTEPTADMYIMSVPETRILSA